jgi:hypothetical protein
MSIISLPWSFKILYGITSDNVPIMGTRRKSYLTIMSVLFFISMISIYSFCYEDPLVFALVLSVSSLCLAFINVVSNATMVI